MAAAVAGAQQALQQAGQSPSGQSGSDRTGSSSPPRDRSAAGPQPASGSGLGPTAGLGRGGSVGPQKPLAGTKRNVLIRGAPNPRGAREALSRTGTPDPTRDRAAYYSLVPERVRAAEASLNREDIPAAYKKTVRDYFEAIQPQ